MSDIENDFPASPLTQEEVLFGADVGAPKQRRKKRVKKAGAMPSHTAPANPISLWDCESPSFFKPLRWSFDSLYLSYRGNLHTKMKSTLENLKRLAQSDSATDASIAQLQVGDHCFEVKDKGKGHFFFVLVDNAFHIQLSRNASELLPFAYIQIGAEFMAQHGLDAEPLLRTVIEKLGVIEGEATISRVDPFADFQTSYPIEAIRREEFIYRPRRFNTYHDGDVFTGISIGLGGELSARLYNKTHHLKAGRYVDEDHYLYTLWETCGWKPTDTDPVWRMEFELKRGVLQELRINTVADLEREQHRLWEYLTCDWLRIVLPNPGDSHKERWKPHPLWERIMSFYGDDSVQPRLKRNSFERLPSEHWLYRNGFAGLSSYMAIYGGDSPEKALLEYYAKARDYFERKNLGERFDGYILNKKAIKARKHNTILNEESNRA